MAKSGRYLFGQKLSDAQIERVLREYVRWRPAGEVIREAKLQGKQFPSAKSIYHIYALTRRRLKVLGIYPDHALFVESYADTDVVRRIYAEKSEKVAELMDRHRGITTANRGDLIAEAVFRVERGQVSPAALLKLIKKAALITGPFNRPPVNLQIWHHRRSVHVFQTGTNEFRRTASDTNKIATQFYESMIEYHNREERALVRAGHRIKAASVARRGQSDHTQWPDFEG